MTARHWLLWEQGPKAKAAIVWNATLVARARELGRRIEGPFTLAVSDLNLVAHWVVTAPSKPVLRIALPGEDDAKLYTDHGWALDGPFAPADHLTEAIELMHALRRFVPSEKPEQGPLPEWIVSLRGRVDSFLADHGP